MRVLVADDDLGSRLVAQAAVEGLGHECRIAADGDEAWEIWQTYHPDVLITDRVMPGLDGLTLCRVIRAAEHDAYTYIVLVTSSDRREDVLSGLQAGADDYIVKPLDLFTLEARLLVARRVTSLHAELTRTRVELSEQAHTDPLTKLHNRLRLNEDLEMLHANSERYGRPYSLGLCDVDYFKRYNDTYGHQAGDEALRTVADTLSRHAREGDRLYRYGGEEFLLLLPEQSARAAAKALERFRAALQGLRIEHASGPVGVLTCSVGIATYVPGSLASSAQLLKSADEALYQAKAAGRNRIAMAESDAGPSLL